MGWVASDPHSAEAAQALALSLFLLGEPSAIDTLMRAKSLAIEPAERQRVAMMEIWMRVQFALPADLRALRKARDLADSLLAARSSDPVDPETLASIAALTGHAFEAERLERRAEGRVLGASSPLIRLASRTMVVFAAFGGPADTLRALEQRIDSLVATSASPDLRAMHRAGALGRAAGLAFPDVQLSAVASLGTSNQYLLNAEAAYVRGDNARALQVLTNMQHVRDAFLPLDPTIDGLYPEAWLLGAMGDTRSAIERLDPALSNLRASSYLVDPITAATLVRAMAYRADLAARAGDRRSAALWAAAVAELWANADEFLQPLVKRMRQLAVEGE